MLEETELKVSEKLQNINSRPKVRGLNLTKQYFSANRNWLRNFYLPQMPPEITHENLKRKFEHFLEVFDYLLR